MILTTILDITSHLQQVETILNIIENDQELLDNINEIKGSYTYL